MSRIETFTNFYKSTSTKKNYKAYLRKYFKTFYKGNEEDFDIDIECEKYFSKERDYDADMRALLDTKYLDKPIQTRLYSLIKQFGCKLFS